jgi:hypothetical protein
MADITVTAANVVQGDGADVENGIFGATVTAGQVVYKDAADQRFKLCDANSGTAAARVPYGIALNGGATGQPAAIQKAGNINPGGTVVVGQTYVASANAGGIAPVSDLATGHYVSHLGIGITSSLISMGIKVSGVAVP